MPPKKKLNKNTKRYIFIILFLFLWFWALISDTDSIFWEYLIRWLTIAFWWYYKWIFAPVLIMLAAFMIKDEKINFNFYRFIWLVFYFISLISLIGFFDPTYNTYLNIFPFINQFLWKAMAVACLFLVFLISLVIIFDFSPVNFLNKMFQVPAKIWEIKDTFVWEWIKIPKREKNNVTFKKLKSDNKIDELKEERQKLKEEKEKLEREKALEKQSKINFEKVKDIPKKIEIEEKKFWLFWKKSEKTEETPKRPVKIWNWTLPSLNLLRDPVKQDKLDKNDIRRKQIEIQEKLLQFKIEVEMSDYLIWPTVIQYRLKPKEWIKLQKIVNLKDDLALALHAKSIRIQAPIPGIWAVWVEVPNPKREAVYLKEVLNSKEFLNSGYNIPIAVWKSVSWNTIVWDLTKMPHLLVAWQTASWKSVWVNWFIISMLYKFSPTDLKFLMIDPKRVELSIYNWIPHLLTPVATTADKALNILKRSVAEMLRRYDIASKINAKNLIEYNKKVTEEEKFSYIIIIIDELADLMMSWDKKEIETSIARIAQMWRAVGMHLIVATQRPSVNVLTWLIKANIPSRIAFTVASQVDSRTILDSAWAEDLLWRWDMLYYPTWTVEAERVQWVFVETDEIEAIVNQLKLTVDPDMLQNLQNLEISEWKSKFEWSIMEKYDWEQDEDPEIIEKAIAILRETRKWSTSLLQRRLWLGYARAAKVLDILENLWIVWPSNWSKPREVYLD